MMLTMEDDKRMVVKLMELGANGYISKASDGAMLYAAIKNCYEDKLYFNALIRTTVFNTLRQSHAFPGEHHRRDISLSEKEIAVLRLICEEKSTKEIAETIYLSPRTIESIRDNLKAKIGAKRTAGLIMYALKNSILDQGTNW